MAERETWIESVRLLGAAVLDLVRAEAAAAARDLGVFFKQVGIPRRRCRVSCS